MNIDDLNFLKGQSLIHKHTGEIGTIIGFYLLPRFDGFEIRVNTIDKNNYYWVEKYHMIDLKHNSNSFFKQLVARNGDDILNSRLYKLLT